MRLVDAARRFDKMACLDGYTGVLLFYAQLSLYDDTKRDSETAQRRILSLAPEISLPTRRVVEAAGTRFIIGHGNPDTHLGQTLRVGHVAHEATALATVSTLTQLCLNQAGTTAWAGRAWLKDLSYSEQRSDLAPQHHLHFARSEAIALESVIGFENQKFIVRSQNFGAGGTLVVLCEQMPEPVVEMATFTASGTYDPLTEAFAGASAAVRVVRMRWQSLFTYRSNLAPKFGPDDMQIAVAKSAFTVRPGQALTMSDGSWRVDSALDEGTVWLAKVTRYV